MKRGRQNLVNKYCFIAYAHVTYKIPNSVNSFNTTHVVYKINCSNCKSCYIGQTSRPLITIIKEHKANVKLAVKKLDIISNHCSHFFVSLVKGSLSNKGIISEILSVSSNTVTIKHDTVNLHEISLF